MMNQEKINYMKKELEPLPDMLKMIKKGSTQYMAKIRAPHETYMTINEMTKHFDANKEHLFLFCLDTKNQIKSTDIISIGTLNANIVHPREIFYAAIVNRSASIILAHNHPSGDPTPSQEDIAVTEKIIKGRKMLGIDVLDHVIIGKGQYVSLKDEGIIK